MGRLGCGSSHTSGCAVPSAQLLNWTRTHFAAFAIASSPLVLSIHPSDATLAPLLDIIGNKRALAVRRRSTALEPRTRRSERRKHSAHYSQCVRASRHLTRASLVKLAQVNHAWAGHPGRH